MISESASSASPTLLTAAAGDNDIVTQIDQGWGAGPSARYEQIAARFRPLFKSVRATAVARDNDHHLPVDEIKSLKQAGFSKLRLPLERGGLGITLPEFYALLIELSEADPNITNAFRSHFGFSEDILNAPSSPKRTAWLDRIANGETIGSGFSETGDAKASAASTRLSRSGDHWILNGRKYYTSGSLYADWINLGATDDEGKPIGALVPTSAEGVEILDDWDGFGQTLSASGTAIFTNVVIPDDLINPVQTRFRYSNGFFQTVHLATLAGIGRAAANDVSRLVAERRRIYTNGNATRVAEDPQVLQVVGKVRAAAYGAGAIALKTAEALQRVHDADRAGDAQAADAANVAADIEVSQAVTVISNLVLDATTILFDALGASAAKRTNGLDRHWRNARTIASHNPRIYRERAVGDFSVNGTKPAVLHRAGLPDSPDATKAHA